ncbi:para-aminobenzoate synthetase [Xenorhabdus cabanillasii]|uniref:aminodeoxychorismate synthase n=1 Tax=Xenorhabdus cabanillasii TaxID=351673 RepID=A0A3D9UP60_9GAMM|nr:aminodeoxychorismate synthase [Xenorhabdus cabanillasii]REF26481.1 para-aminobenzoate synthetase [Xenorhabdus cabanillasii]
MKTLIIDNYDSFTYNLVHLFTSVTKHEPTVIKNDCPDWRNSWLQDFDLVVISPGPGHPGNAVDMGISREVLQQREFIKPLLGVCLGHQGLCLEAGARVSHAPEPMHGRICSVNHIGDDLFQGIPQRFKIVRYHSLAVYDLPEILHPLAWTDDNILMAVAHQELPFWGCQFHPESVSSEYGFKLIENFCLLSHQYDYKRTSHFISNPVSYPYQSIDVDKKTVKEHKVYYQMMVEEDELKVGTETLFQQIFTESEYAFWLDSNDLSTERGRFSIMGDASSEESLFVTADTRRNILTVNSNQDKQSIEKTGIFDWLHRQLEEAEIVNDNEYSFPFDVRPGWFGYLGYELKKEVVSGFIHQSSMPDAAMIFTNRIIVCDHKKNRWYAIAIVIKDNIYQYEQARIWLTEIKTKIAKIKIDTNLDDFIFPRAENLKLRHSASEYIKLVEACQEEIRNGESYEICLTNEITFDLKENIDHLSLYCALRKENPTPFSAFIRCLKQWSVLSFSPERFMKVGCNGIAESRPIKGTRKRISDGQQDALMIKDLSSNEKDRAENLMIVDLVRNDLGRVAKACKVTSGPLFEVESFATVHQLVSTIRAELREDKNAVDCIKYAFPGGSMTGAPKIRAMELIDKFESAARGVYSGAIGYFSANGSADFSIVIRTLIINQQHVSIGTGGAIISLSNPRDELEEIVIKSSALLKPFDLYFPLGELEDNRQDKK